MDVLRVRSWVRSVDAVLRLQETSSEGAHPMTPTAEELRELADDGIYTPEWKTYGKQAGNVRNQQMVDTKPDLVLAFHRNNSNGTADAIQRALKAEIPVRVFSSSELDPDPACEQPRPGTLRRSVSEGKPR